jgi:hypothetical protein
VIEDFSWRKSARVFVARNGGTARAEGPAGTLSGRTPGFGPNDTVAPMDSTLRRSLRRASIGILAVLLLSGCSAVAGDDEPHARTQSPEVGDSHDTLVPHGSLACVSALSRLSDDVSSGTETSEAFSTTLSENASGPSSGFAEVADTASDASSDEANVASDLSALVPLTKADYSAAASSAAVAMASASRAISAFGAAAAAYAQDETNLTTVHLNQTAADALQAPIDAAAALDTVTSIFTSSGGQVCAG